MSDIPFLTVRVESWSDVPGGLHTLVEDFKHRVIPEQEKAERWDYVRVELWPDSGRFIAFPALGGEKFRVDVTGGQLICAEVEADLGRLDVEDPGFDEQAEAIVQRMIELVIPAFAPLSEHPLQVWDPEKRLK